MRHIDVFTGVEPFIRTAVAFLVDPLRRNLARKRIGGAAFAWNDYKKSTSFLIQQRYASLIVAGRFGKCSRTCTAITRSKKPSGKSNGCWQSPTDGLDSRKGLADRRRAYSRETHSRNSFSSCSGVSFS